MKSSLKPEIKKYIQELTVDCYDNHMLLLEKLCEKLKLGCFEADFDDDEVSGLLMKDKKGDSYNIYVNRKHSPNRKRFTVAHEIGHYISFLKGSYSTKELKHNHHLTDHRMVWRHTQIKSAAEREANLIAAEILMPKDKIEELVRLGKTPEEMAKLFYVSLSAMTYRLMDVCPDALLI